MNTLKDTCVLCHCETSYNRETHIAKRTGYVEGVGQCCIKCYNKLEEKEDVQIRSQFDQGC